MSVITVKAVTVKEFTDWIKNNLHMTWWRGKGGGFDFRSDDEKKHSPVFKYFYPAIDTRDGKIFHIGTNVGPVDFRDQCHKECKTVLDLLEYKFEQLKDSYGSEPEHPLYGKLKAKFGDELDFEQIKSALAFIAEDCTEELWKSKGGYDIDYKKESFNYYDMREKFSEVVERLH